jgi:aminoglycoside 3-N-acetyltransferase
MTGEQERPPAPVGFEGLVRDLRSLGVGRGQDLLVHCSMRRVGPVAGGAGTLLAAIREVAGPAASVVVPAQTRWNSRTSDEFRAVTADLDPDEYDRYVAALPVYDPATTPSSGMGAFAEYVRTRPGARRSAHPQTSFAALGPRAADYADGHDPECHLGERSPLRSLYDAGAAILLLGVGYDVCTAFHLAEYRIPGAEHIGGADLDESDFGELGAAFETAYPPGAGQEAAPRAGLVGRGASRRVPVCTAVDFARKWLPSRRNLADDVNCLPKSYIPLSP